MKKQVEMRLADAIEKETPDVLPRILQAVAEKGETREPAPQYEAPVVRHTTNLRALRAWVVAAAAVLVLTLGGMYTYQNLTPDSSVALDVNPSILLTVNRRERVLSVTPQNADAEVVLDGMDLKNVDLDVAVNALIGSMLTHGYISELANSVLISVENSDPAKATQLQEHLAQRVGELLRANNLDGSVLSQTVTEDASVQALAEQYGISEGKASLIQKLVALDATLTAENLAKLQVNDIKLLIEARQETPAGVSSEGTASSAAYLGTDVVKEIALADAGLSAAATTFYEVSLDTDDGQMVYELEFVSAGTEYEYEIDATTGAILQKEQKGNNIKVQAPAASAAPATATTAPASTPAVTAVSSLIGLEAAKDIALKDAGLSASEVTFSKAKQDEEDGVQVYELEFRVGKIKYEYEINAVTGAILKAELDD
ncbi:MAG: PepSY domain-containing protein [Oscillospiraceae bacterium]|nr:PepSY domain-containing protein [Oscillospiraceae bacterium]